MLNERHQSTMFFRQAATRLFIVLVLITNSMITLGQENLGRGTGLEPKASQLLQSYCHGCHGHEEPDAGLDLAHFRTIESLRESPDVWKKVMRRIMNGSMPPMDSKALDEADRKYLSHVIDQALHAIDCTNASYPGQVTIRRLNRVEYQNSVRDLLGYVYQPAENFPGDDIGYGFDNIGDVLSLPPVLMEKYLEAAETISRQVIDAPEDRVPVEVPLANQDWETEGGVTHDGGFLSFYANGIATFKISCQDAQEERIRIRARGDQAGDEPVKMSVFLNRKRVQRVTIDQEDVATIEIAVRFPKGNSHLRLAFDNDYYNPNHADVDQRDRNLIVESVVRLHSAPPVAERIAPNQTFFFLKAERPADEEAVARRLLSVWSSRFFRRPVEDAEVERLMAIYRESRQEQESFERGLQYALQAILVSPKFLFKVEAPPPADGQVAELSSFELATSLSFFLWLSTPDAELLQTALKKNLQDPAILQDEARRMLRDEKVKRLAENFAIQWLQLRGLASFEPDPERFGGAHPALFEDMRQETVLFFQEMLRSDRSILELLDADYTFVNRRLAHHYGFQTVPESDAAFVKIKLVDQQRGGLLSQGAVLAVTSNPTRTSPVKRGKWIMENLLGDAPPPALPDVMPLEQQKLTGTLRQQMEQHRRDPQCASCHEVMDQLGFALENFDVVGRWRTEDEGGVVDPSGVLPSGERFSGPAELRRLLVTEKRKEFVRCLTEKFLIYALGRGLRFEDQCVVNEITARLEKNEYRFSELILGIVESVPFRQRQRISGDGP